MTQDNTRLEGNSKVCRMCRATRRALYHSRAMFSGYRELVIKRDSEKCIKCGITRDEHKLKYGRDITVDHIDGKGMNAPKSEKNNDLSNLQTLCLSCHMRKDTKIRKITLNTAVNIIHMQDALTAEETAELYGLNAEYVNRLQRGVVWKHLPRPPKEVRKRIMIERRKAVFYKKYGGKDKFREHMVNLRYGSQS